MPGLKVARAEGRPRETVTALGDARSEIWLAIPQGPADAPRSTVEAVLRRDWRRRRIGARRRSLRLLSARRNGGAKQIMDLVALMAVSAFAFWAGPLVAGALGFAGSAFATGLATDLIGLGGALLVNALITPNPGATNAPDSTQDQICSVLAQGNTAKLGQPLPGAQVAFYEPGETVTLSSQCRRPRSTVGTAGRDGLDAFPDRTTAPGPPLGAFVRDNVKSMSARPLFESD
jgi:hypothetical protein